MAGESSKRFDWRSHLRSRTAVVGLGAFLAAAVVFARCDAVAHEASLARSLAVVVGARGVELDPESVVWLDSDDEGPFRYRGVVFVGRRDGSSDVFYAAARASGTAILDVRALSNLTSTTSADEGPLVAVGTYAAYLSRVGDRFDAVGVLDLRGDDPSETATWPLRARVQDQITNLQESGRRRGFGRMRWAFLPPAASATLTGEGERLALDLDGQRVVIDPVTRRALEGAENVEARPNEKALPGTITWLVDTVRSLEFVGPEPIAWLEHRVFAVKDRFDRWWYDAVGTDTEAAVAEDFGLDEATEARLAALAVTNPELGWPPAPVEPVVERPARGEGHWIPIADDPFLHAYPGAPTVFYQTFLQVDPERPFTRVYIVVWDPRQVQLRVMTGTREPVSATGETGPGIVPREPETLGRLVAGFNGGFQALHGEFGMMSEGRVYLPPKPWAATVAVFDDGRVAMGSWPGPPRGVREFREDWAIAQIPEGVVELRQNLTSVVEDGVYNPWKRWWWGAAPLNAEEQVFIDRSGLCLTSEGFMAYFWGQSMGPDELGKAMVKTRCVRALHLDMNGRHTAFELYDVRAANVPFAPLERPIGEHEYEGPVPGFAGFHARARTLVRSMSPMRFPRYIDRDPRDFFYLVQRPVLPGPPIALAERHPKEGVFDTEGLPHPGWPPAFARAYLGESARARTWLVRIDPSRALFPDVAPADHGPPLAWLTGTAGPPSDRRFGLYAERRLVGWTFAVGRVPEGAVLLRSGLPIESERDADAALGVDGDGFLVYAERQPDDETPLFARLRAAGVARAIALDEGVRLAFVVDELTVAPSAYERPVTPETSIPLFGASRPATEILFPDVRPRPYVHWGPIQDSRVRYFRDGDPPRFRAPLPDGGVPP